MFKLNKMSAATLAYLAVVAVPALAQQQLERVEVTGSRILSPNAESPAPIQVLTAADIQASGATNLQDLLQKNPTFGTPTISRTNSNFSTSSAGVSTINLRNLGVDRTLVLVNGRRYVSGVPGSMAVDLNTIPTDFIERVEVMTGGASSTYGSDAVAGVVNIILKRNFEGVNLDASWGQSWKSDDTLKKFSATFGTNAAGGKGNVMAHFAVSKQGAVYSRDRDASAVDQFSVGAGVTGEASDIFAIQRPFYSSFAPQGRFFFTNAAGTATNRTFDANGNLIPFSTNGPAGDGVGATGYNRSSVRTIAIPTTRVLMATKGDYQLNESHSVFFEGTYANTKTFTHLEPFPLDSDVQVTPGNGLVHIPAETLVNGVKIANPLIPAALLALMTDRTNKDGTGGDGLRDYNFTRRMSDVADRTSSANRDTFRVVGGVKGDLAKSWSYETYVGYGFTREGQTSTGQVNVNNLYNALQVIPDAFGVPMCVDANARKQGCVPANIFGANTLSAAASKYISAPGSLNTSVTQKMAGASVSGEAFNLPAGPIGIAAGYEWRQEGSSTEFDALTQSGLNGGNALANTAGRYTVRELFVETKIPLLVNLPLVKSLDGTVAYRHGDYSSVGGTNSWNLGLDWAVNSTFRTRATLAQSTRAPNVADLYQGASQTFPTGLQDPCQNVLSTDTSALGIACKSYPGVVANMAANNGKFTLGQADVQGVSGFDSGNPNLKAEKGRSLTVGFVITPKSIALLKNFSFTADYYDIKIASAINLPGRQYTLDQCFKQNNPLFCSFITRRTGVQGAYSAGSLEYINQGPVNSGGQKAKGIDLTAAYAERVGPGTLSSRLSYTYLLDAWNQPTDDDASRDTSLNEVGNSRNRWMLNLGYSSGPWSIDTTTTFIGTSYLDDQFMNQLCNTDDAGKCQPARKEQGKVSSKTYFDLQGSYKWGKAQFYVGVNNLFNTKAPPIISGLPANVTGAETDAGTYDAIGRRYYVGARYSF
ncbi:TonB-dependent receptor domain-containing protein [Roseateles cellulosilyticus]|uniref:TonB-dependent receptor n=1 Tax=Pelomonas cellulosilytica TaxID=2906762 RepID=A0ABS8XPL8_9BURK|nr:TonB-dependent receptor [Pelomonas sp. P8]MCE4553685.1 TonB-dependent receptor [Pelomonas sp. P8]